MHNLHLLVFSRSFFVPSAGIKLMCIDNGAHGIEKILLKTQVSEDFAC